MAATATRASDSAPYLADSAGITPRDYPADATVLGSLTIPGRPEHVREARALVAKVIGGLHPALDTAILLTSELVTNAVIHSSSRCAGGMVRVTVLDGKGSLRIEVADEGSELSSPVVRGDLFASDGHGLFLVQALADQWGYLRDERGTTVWFSVRQAASHGRAGSTRRDPRRAGRAD
jgi:anti-sigma regulatory factor (Ser/Thr protein kinase)